MLALSLTGAAQKRESHIRDLDRLVVLQDSVTVTGIVKRCYKYLDGDFVIELKLDSNLALIGQGNLRKLNGLLEVEVICQHLTLNLKCCGYYNDIVIPKRNDRVLVMGTYVYDVIHKWNEIHPVKHLVILKQ